MTLEEIIEGCRRGNAEARRELYVHYGSPMYGVIRRYVSDASTAEDLLHDGFVTLYTRIGDYRGDGPFEGWCRRIFVNTVMSYFRRRNPLEGADEVSAANLRSSVPPTVLDELSAGEIKACVDTLPEGYRTIFNLRAVEEYEYAEICGDAGNKRGDHPLAIPPGEDETDRDTGQKAPYRHAAAQDGRPRGRQMKDDMRPPGASRGAARIKRIRKDDR